MARKHAEGYLSARESRRITRENRKITNALEKRHKRKNVPESEYLCAMRDENNAVEFDNVHTYFYTDVGTVKAVDGISFDVPIGKTVGVALLSVIGIVLVWVVLLLAFAFVFQIVMFVRELLQELQIISI